MRIEFIDWIYQASSRSLWQQQPLSDEEKQRRERIGVAVRQALRKLPPAERLILEKYFFEGETLATIAEQLGRRHATIINYQRRALKSLRKHLAAFVAEEFGIDQEQPACCICRSPKRAEIEALIAAKRLAEPYGLLMKRIEKEFGLKVGSPQTIIGHQKYHS